MHLSTVMLVYKDLICKLAKYLLFISMSVSWLSSDPEFFMCASLMVPNRGKSLAILWGEANPIPEITGLRGMSGLWVFGRP